MESFCRLCCTSHEGAKLNNLFEEKNSHLLDKLSHFACFALNIDLKAILHICIRCTELLEAAYEFKLICESADARFLALSQSNNDIVKEEVLCSPKIEIASEENRDETLGFLETSNEPISKLSPDNSKQEAGKRRRQRQRQAKGFTCDFCSTSFSRKRELERHMKNVHHPLTNDEKPCHKPSPWICETCGREYKTKHTLTYHINGAHVKAVVKNYSCNLCDYKCREARNLVSHRLVHSGEKKHQCSECGASFGFQSSLYRHIQGVHKREKPHKCTICNQSFYVKSRLKEHFFIHTGQHPLKCTLCSRTYRYHNSLLKHMRKRHQDARKQKQEI